MYFLKLDIVEFWNSFSSIHIHFTNFTGVQSTKSYLKRTLQKKNHQGFSSRPNHGKLKISRTLQLNSSFSNYLLSKTTSLIFCINSTVDRSSLEEDYAMFCWNEIFCRKLCLCLSIWQVLLISADISLRESYPLLTSFRLQSDTYFKVLLAIAYWKLGWNSANWQRL